MNILVTGASKGIGKAIAEELKSVGHIFASGRNEEALKVYEDYCICDLSLNSECLCDFIIKNK